MFGETHELVQDLGDSQAAGPSASLTLQCWPRPICSATRGLLERLLARRRLPQPPSRTIPSPGGLQCGGAYHIPRNLHRRSVMVPAVALGQSLCLRRELVCAVGLGSYGMGQNARM